jgi:hypothetical protein
MVMVKDKNLGAQSLILESYHDLVKDKPRIKIHRIYENSKVI